MQNLNVKSAVVAAIGLGIRGDGALSYADPRLEWLLVSDMSWSPWAPLFHCMQLEAPWLPKRGADSFLLDRPELTLESKVASLEYLEALASFDKTTIWDVVFWRVLYLPHVVGHLAPRRATIVPLFSGEFFNVCLPSRSVANEYQHASRVGAMLMLASLRCPSSHFLLDPWPLKADFWR